MANSRLTISVGGLCVAAFGKRRADLEAAHKVERAYDDMTFVLLNPHAAARHEHHAPQPPSHRPVLSIPTRYLVPPYEADMVFTRTRVDENNGQVLGTEDVACWHVDDCDVRLLEASGSEVTEFVHAKRGTTAKGDLEGTVRLADLRRAAGGVRMVHPNALKPEPQLDCVSARLKVRAGSFVCLPPREADRTWELQTGYGGAAAQGFAENVAVTIASAQSYIVDLVPNRHGKGRAMSVLLDAVGASLDLSCLTSGVRHPEVVDTHAGGKSLKLTHFDAYYDVAFPPVSVRHLPTSIGTLVDPMFCLMATVGLD